MLCAILPQFYTVLDVNIKLCLNAHYHLNKQCACTLYNVCIYYINKLHFLCASYLTNLKWSLLSHPILFSFCMIKTLISISYTLHLLWWLHAGFCIRIKAVTDNLHCLVSFTLSVTASWYCSIETNSRSNLLYTSIIQYCTSIFHY